jgi:hypothetical protein
LEIYNDDSTLTDNAMHETCKVHKINRNCIKHFSLKKGENGNGPTRGQRHGQKDITLSTWKSLTENCKI